MKIEEVIPILRVDKSKAIYFEEWAKHDKWVAFGIADNGLFSRYICKRGEDESVLVRLDGLTNWAWSFDSAQAMLSDGWQIIDVRGAR